MTAPTKALRGRRLRAALAAPALLALLSVAFYWKLTLSRDYVWFDQPDMAYIELPRVGFQAHAIHGGRFPLWDPNIWVGQPLIGQTQPGPLYPLNLLLCLMPLRDGYVQFTSLNWHYVLMRFLAALFCYWLCRDLRLSRGASVLAGCAFGFSGFLGSVAWLDVANGALTTPLVFLFLFRAVRGEFPARNAALSGLFLGVAWLSGHHEIPLLVSMAVAATWAWHSLEPALAGRRPDWRLLGLGGVLARARRPDRRRAALAHLGVRPPGGALGRAARAGGLEAAGAVHHPHGLLTARARPVGHGASGAGALCGFQLVSGCGGDGAGGAGAALRVGAEACALAGCAGRGIGGLCAGRIHAAARIVLLAAAGAG